MPRHRNYSDDNDLVFKCKCFLCEQQRQAGRGRYEGRNVATWNVWICETCRNGNWDGIVVAMAHGKRIVVHLEANGIEVRLNSKGHLPISD